MNNKIKTAGGIVLKDDKILFIYKREVGSSERKGRRRC